MHHIHVHTISPSPLTTFSHLPKLHLLILSLQITISNSSSAKDTATAAIKANKVMVFSKTHCPYCKKAKEEIKKLDPSFGLMELDEVKDGADVQAALLDMTGQRTVPNIFVNGKHVGGCDNVRMTFTYHSSVVISPSSHPFFLSLFLSDSIVSPPMQTLAAIASGEFQKMMKA